MTATETFDDWYLDPESERGSGYLAAIAAVLPDLAQERALRLGVDHCRQILSDGGVSGPFSTDLAAVRARFAEVGDLTDVQAQALLDAVLTWVCPEFQ